MKDRNTSIIITVAAVVLCGCPGLIGLFAGGLTTMLSFVPGADIDIFGSSEPRSALIFGLSILCLSIIFIAIPALVGYFLLGRNKAKDPLDNLDDILDDELPPAI